MKLTKSSLVEIWDNLFRTRVQLQAGHCEYFNVMESENRHDLGVDMGKKGNRRRIGTFRKKWHINGHDLK